MVLRAVDNEMVLGEDQVWKGCLAGRLREASRRPGASRASTERGSGSTGLGVHSIPPQATVLGRMMPSGKQGHRVWAWGLIRVQVLECRIRIWELRNQVPWDVKKGIMGGSGLRV